MSIYFGKETIVINTIDEVKGKLGFLLRKIVSPTPTLLTLLTTHLTPFHDQKRYNFKITLNGRDLTTESIKEDLFYLSDLKRMPGNLRVSDFLTLVMDVQKTGGERQAEIIREFRLDEIWRKSFGKLDIHETGNIVLALLSMRSYRVYLFKDITRGMDRDFLVRLSDCIDGLCERDSMVNFLAADNYFRNIEPGYYFKEDKDWDRLVEHWREMIAGDTTSPDEDESD